MDALSIYQRLPYPLRCTAATVRGWRLDRTRYGADLEPLVASALERDRWSADRWSVATQEALADQLRRAARLVPAYDDRPTPQTPHDALHALAEWPVTTKQQLRADPRALVVEGSDPRDLVADHTSGTTGTPLTVYADRHGVRRWYSLFEARVRRWHGVARGDSWAIMGGQLVARVGQAKPPYWVWNAAGRQLYLSVVHLADHTALAYVTALRRHGVRYVLGYPSAIATLAAGIEAAGVEAPRLEVVLTNAEPLFDHQRSLISRVFQCPVRDTYGMSEAVAGASECEAGTMHLWPDAGYVEIVDADDRPVPLGEPGRVVATALLNQAMPLIRYDTGDVAAIAANGGCACGRTLPIVRSIEGRNDDMVVLADGRRIGRLDPVFKTDLEIEEAQIVQRTLTDFVMRVVPAAGYGDHTAEALRRRLCERVGDVHVEVEPVAAIERTANGKLRAVISLVSAGDALEQRPPLG